MENKESVIDTLVDLMGYSLIGIAIKDDKWNDYPHGIRSSSYRDSIVRGMLKLFETKLEAYGTKDLRNIEQILQRMKEKIGRIENIENKDGGKSFIRVLKTGEDGGILMPQKHGDVGFDLVASEDTIVRPSLFGVTNIPCGFRAKLPDGHWAEIRPRSSTPSKLGLLVHSSVMDEGYTGPWFVVCSALGHNDVVVKKGTRVAQCVLFKSRVPAIMKVTDLPDTERGDTGFGSSGQMV